MGFKGLVYFGLLLSLVLLISSDVAAKDLAEKQDHNGVNDYPGGGRGGGRGGDYPGGGRGGGRGGDYPGGGRGGDYPGGGGRGGGRYDPPRRGCYHGCCKRSNYGPPRCLRCCSYAGEAIDIQT